MNAVAEKIEAQEIRVHRFTLVDLNGYGWMVARLKERYPAKSDGQLLGWLRGIFPTNEHFFLCSPHAVMLARFEQDYFAQVPIVVERFVLVEKPEYVHEAEALYDHLARWAVGLGAVEMQVGVFSDVPPAYLKERFGRTFVRSQTFVRLGK